MRLPKAVTTILKQAEQLEPDELERIGAEHVRRPIPDAAVDAVLSVTPRHTPQSAWLYRTIQQRANAITIRAWGNPSFWAHGQHLGSGPAGAGTVAKRCASRGIQAACYAAMYGDLLHPAVKAELLRCWEARKEAKAA